MVSRESDSSMTKATLTEGKITLNKDTNPTQTTAKALGINTELSQANQQIQQPKDINKMLKEQQTFAQSAGNVAGAVNAYANQKAEEARAKAEEAKSSGNPTAYTQAKAEQESWEQGGSARRNAQTVANVINIALAGGNAGAIGVAAVSPYLNEKIKEATTEENGEVNKPANLLGHAILGAIEAKATGNNALAGAVAGATGEVTAMLLTQGKSPKDLTESEKQNVVVLSQLASGLAGAVVGDSSQNAVAGAEIGKRAVENNYLYANESKRLAELEQKAIAGTITTEEQSEREALKRKDLERDQALVSACEGAVLTAGCNSQRKELEQAKFSYSYGENNSVGYGYPSYTKLRDLYSENYGKIAYFSDKYDVPKNAKEQANAGFEKSTGWNPIWLDRATVALGAYVGSRIALASNDFTKQAPSSISGKDKQVVVGETTNYKTIKVDFSKSIIKGSDESYIVNNLESNAYYELSNGTKFKTNNYGYVEEISYFPVDMKMPRDKRQTQVGKEGLSTDVGGHIQACSQGGTCDRYNLFPQDANFNNSAYKRYFENVIAKAIKEGKQVEVNTKLIRDDPSSSRPDRLRVSFEIDGKRFTNEFKNETGVKNE